MIRQLIMWYKHKTDTNKGKVIFWNDKQGNNCIGFECECGEVHGESIIDDKHIDDMLVNLKIEKNAIS